MTLCDDTVLIHRNNCLTWRHTKYRVRKDYWGCAHVIQILYIINVRSYQYSIITQYCHTVLVTLFHCDDTENWIWLWNEIWMLKTHENIISNYHNYINTDSYITLLCNTITTHYYITQYSTCITVLSHSTCNVIVFYSTLLFLLFFLLVTILMWLIFNDNKTQHDEYLL